MKVLLTFDFGSIQEAQEYLARIMAPVPVGVANVKTISEAVVSIDKWLANDPLARTHNAPNALSDTDPEEVADFPPTKRARKAAAVKAEKIRAANEIKIPSTPANLESVRAKLAELFNAKGRAPVALILKNAGAPSVSDLDPGMYAAVLQNAEAALAAK